jgi:hypothetical protein
MNQPPKPKPGHYLRRSWKIEKHVPGENSNKGYIPSYERPGFDERKVIKLKAVWE